MPKKECIPHNTFCVRVMYLELAVKELRYASMYWTMSWARDSANCHWQRMRRSRITDKWQSIANFHQRWTLKNKWLQHSVTLRNVLMTTNANASYQTAVKCKEEKYWLIQISKNCYHENPKHFPTALQNSCTITAQIDNLLSTDFAVWSEVMKPFTAIVSLKFGNHSSQAMKLSIR